jgi:hypothetical protein
MLTPESGMDKPNNGMLDKNENSSAPFDFENTANYLRLRRFVNGSKKGKQRRVLKPGTLGTAHRDEHSE